MEGMRTGRKDAHTLGTYVSSPGVSRVLHPAFLH